MNIEITTIIGCYINCTYCPQSNLQKAYKGNKEMSFNDFEKLLKNVPKTAGIVFAGYSEAFLNKRSSYMMRYAIEQGYTVTLYTTLVGFEFKDLAILNGLKFKTVSFHLIVKKRDDFDVKQFAFKQHIKADTWSEETITNPWSRASNLFPETGKGRKCSVAPKFDHNVVLPNGELYLCCMDYSLTEPMGNLFDTNYVDIERKMEYKLCQNCILSCE